jgi:ABC-type cobalamin/Fe3+-siderophores transport system ATPase subunit
MAAAALSTHGLVKRYGALLVTDKVSLDVRPGELHAVIGPNGAGKTTLINQLSGELASDEGQVLFDGQDVTAMPVHRRARAGLLRSYQITSIFEEFTVRTARRALRPRRPWPRPGWSRRPTRWRVNWVTASGANSNWRWHWPPSHVSCCSTNRWPA